MMSFGTRHWNIGLNSLLPGPRVVPHICVDDSVEIDSIRRPTSCAIRLKLSTLPGRFSRLLVTQLRGRRREGRHESETGGRREPL
jgi:hypothetical protein